MSRQSGGRSGAVRSVGYDPTTKALLVICESADAYRYAGVPKEVYDALLAAPSRRQFVRESVEGRYPREKFPCMMVGEEV
ncbi:KTSC domain-containing protein [Methanoculleus sp. FWC-SCC3]|uniref:KTSC domain-containing protein n=1 Tax=Methanoculleus methanifontis TaxID=2584086 RepID=A0ABT8LY99_9EURY|nr:KTSC domain-containing protein [Methanoculleus sp. FWC-SCC3]MDN7011749.1 KTSC domain-containing protein [Methanoculleus sp. FWC-SCC3]